MSVSRETLVAASAETGSRPETLEKVVRLGQLARDVARQPLLSRALVLNRGPCQTSGDQLRSSAQDDAAGVASWLMTKALEEAFREASMLAESEQDSLAAAIRAEIDAEAKWEARFPASANALERMADEALAEHRARRTRPFDPEGR